MMLMGEWSIKAIHHAIATTIPIDTTVRPVITSTQLPPRPRWRWRGWIGGERRSRWSRRSYSDLRVRHTSSHRDCHHRMNDHR